MKKKASLIVAILLLAVGFAAISTTLIINGSAKVGENANDFLVTFTKASLDGTDVYANVISEDKKTLTFTSKDLKALNDTSVLTYEVTNNSSNYDADVTINCTAKANTTPKYTTIENSVTDDLTKVVAKGKLNGTLTMKLNKTSVEDATEEYTCTLVFNAVEKDA